MDSPTLEEQNNEREQLETQKLQEEIKELRRKNNWERFIGYFLPFLTVLAAVVGLVISYNQFNQRLEDDRRSREDQLKAGLKRDYESREKEFQKTFWDKQILLYTEAANATSTIANSQPETDEWKKAKNRFWQLYWGELVLVEDIDVSKAMKEFGNCLKGFGDQCDTPAKREFTLKQLSFKLSNECRKSLVKSWSIPLNELPLQR